MSEDMSSERVSKDLSERMSKDMSERCQKECQKICQKECQKICQAECQKICPKYMCIHRSGLQEFMFAPTESCGWHLVFCFIWHTAASTVGSTLFLCKEVEFGLAAMAEVVVERPETIFIGDCQSGCQRSWTCVALQVDFCWCWAHVRVHGAA